MKRTINLRKTIIVIAVLMLAFACTMLLVKNVIPGIKAANVQQNTKELYHGKTISILNYLFPTALAEETDNEEEETEENIEEEIEVPPIQEDFKELYEANEHIVGWLTAGKSIDYAVVQFDNDFYLTHDFYGKPDSNGTIFINEANTIYPADDVLLIHGHNMGSGAMFGTLKHFEDYKYLCEYPIVTFRTIYDEEDVYYTPIAAFNASMLEGTEFYFDITKINFEDDPDTEEDDTESIPVRMSTAYSEYLTSLSEWSLWQPKTDANTDDKLIMLVTCSYYHTDGRLMLVCRKLREDETPEMITELYAEELETTK